MPKDQSSFIASTGTHFYSADGSMTLFSLLFVAADGCCFASSVSLNSELGVVEWDDMTGVDCDPVYAISLSGKTLYTCCRDSVIRKYTLA